MSHNIGIIIAGKPAKRIQTALEYIEALTYFLTIQSNSSFENKMNVNDDTRALYLERVRTLINNFVGISLHNVDTPKVETPESELITKPRNLRANAEIAIATAGGNSLNGKGILDGDKLVVDVGAIVKNGDLAIIERVEDGKTLAKIIRFIGNGKVRLEAANEKYEPLIMKFADIKIIGRVIRFERYL